MLSAIKRGEATDSMMPSNLGYSLREAGKHFRRNWSTSFGGIITIFLSLFIIGLFAIGSIMISNVLGTVEDSVTVRVYIDDSVSDDDFQAFADKVADQLREINPEAFAEVMDYDYPTMHQLLLQTRILSAAITNSNAAVAAENAGSARGLGGGSSFGGGGGFSGGGFGGGSR